MPRRWGSAILALVVLLVAAPLLTLSLHAPRQPMPAREAVHDALRSRAVVAALAGTHWSSAEASAIDGQLERVSFFAGGRQVAQAALRADGTVEQVEALAHEAVPYGDWIAYEPAVLAGLSALFILMAGVAPLRRRRNLDVLAMLSMVAPVVLLQRGYLGGSTVAALPGLGYLLVRCTRHGLGRGYDTLPSTPLYDWITQRLAPAQRVRVLRLLLIALMLVFVMVGVSSPSAVDVAYAAMEGATQIVRGLLPYGHMPGDIIHGDTYPILTYALYVPVAWVAPVNSILSSVDAGLAVAVLAALATAAALRARRPAAPGAEAAGLRAAITWLSFPPLMAIASTGTTDVVLAAMLAFAVLLWRRPAASMTLLAVAGWFKLAPFALVPVWLAPLRGQRLLTAIAALIGVSAAAIGLVWALGGIHGLAAMVHAVAFQWGRGSPQSPWAALGITGLQPVGQACVLGLIAGVSARVRHHPADAGDRTRVAALAAAILIALQIVADSWTFLYLAWFVPLIGMSLFVERAPDVALAGTDTRAGDRSPDPAVPNRAWVVHT